MRRLRNQGKKKHRDREELKHSKRHVKKEAEVGSERCTAPVALEMDEIYKPRSAKDFCLPGGHQKLGQLGRSRGGVGFH